MANNENKVPYLTELSKIEKQMQEEGYTANFRMTDKGLVSDNSQHVYAPEEIRIINFYRFEGVSDPEDSSILYVIETTKGEKGTLSDAYGVYSEPKLDTFIREVENIKKKAHEHKDIPEI